MNEEYYEYVTRQSEEAIRKERRKGRVQGTFITLGIVLFILLAVGVAKLGHKVKNGTILSLVGPGSSVITEDVSQKLDTLKSVIDKYYYEDYDEAALADGMYKGLMSGLGDPYSTYYTKEEYDEMMESSEGTYFGIGAYLQQDADNMQIKVVRPIPDSPAEKVGLMTEDIITQVDGEDISGQDLNLVVSKIRGPKGSQVKITIYRPSVGEYMDFDIIRDKVESITVEYKMLDDEIGYLMLTEFDEVSTGQFTKAMDDLNSQGMKSLILDLRDNPGGNVDVAVDIADYFCPEGLVVYMEDKNGNREEYKSDASHHFEKPVVVLVNENSASASEILCGALIDYDKATLVGTKTFGKGIIQQIMPMGDGSGVKVTVGKYYSPKGRCIHGEGFNPDVEVELDVDKYLNEGIDTQLDKAIEVLKEKK